MTPQTVTEATAHQLLTSIQELKTSLAVATRELQLQSEWNKEQKEINLVVAEKLAALERKDVAADKRLEYLEGWKNWLNGVFTAVLVVTLIAVFVAAVRLAYGGGVP